MISDFLGITRVKNSHEEHHSLLHDLFKPPYDISFNGSFEAAKEFANGIGKWLLVNVQDYREFACQTLNRDIWSNEGVKELIRTNFLFWQVRYDSMDGQRLTNYYNLTTYPAIFILDPRTGEKTYELTMKKLDSVTFCDYFTSFLDKYPDFFALDSHLQKDLYGWTLDAFGNVSINECSQADICDDNNMDRIPRKRRLEHSPSNGKKARISTDKLNKSAHMLPVVDKDDWRQEVTDSGELCKIRLKFPDERLETVEITNLSKIKALFVLIAGRNFTPEDHIFVLSFPRREFSIENSEIPLSELGFTKNEMVHVEHK